MAVLIRYQVAVLPVIRPQLQADGTWFPARLDGAIEVTVPFAHKLTVTVEFHAPIDEDRVEVCRMAVGNYVIQNGRATISDKPVGFYAYSSVPPNAAIAVAAEHLRASVAEGVLDPVLDEIGRRVIERYDRIGLDREQQVKRGRKPRSGLEHARIAALWRQAQQLQSGRVEDFIGDRLEQQDGHRPPDVTIRQWIYKARKAGYLPPVSANGGGFSPCPAAEAYAKTA